LARLEEFDRSEMINAIWQHRGNVTGAAKTLGCNIGTIYSYAKKYVTVQTAIDEARLIARERRLDIAEMAMEKAAAEGKPWAVKLIFEYEGKYRGFIKRQEIAGVQDAPLVKINVDELAQEVRDYKEGRRGSTESDN
jgi:hypothetical protein